jgi:DNA-binding MarR family transcriptional regulator
MGSTSEPLWRQAMNHMLHFAFVLKAEIEAELGQDLSIGLADHEALINIRESGGSLRMTDIADKLVLSRGGITKLVDRLEQAGYVARVPSAEDRRVTMVEITKSGRATVARSRSIIDDVVLARWANRITDAEAEVVIELVRRAYHDEDSALVEESAT